MQKKIWEKVFRSDIIACENVAIVIGSQYGKGAVAQIWTVFRPVYHVTCQKFPWNRTFYKHI